RLAEGLGHHASIALQNARLVADLEAADRLKSEFVSTMSHELRTPLNVIIGYTEMLREGAVGPITLGQRELIDRLDARGRELLELIEATLHVGRLEAGRDMVEISAVALGDLLQALRSCTSGLPRADGVAFEWETPPDLAQRIMTDRAKVSLVVRNLVSNAFKFTSEGQVLVRMLLHDEAMVIEVSDTGVGIGAEHLPIIFDMFRQVDGSATRRRRAAGDAPAAARGIRRDAHRGSGGAVAAPMRRPNETADRAHWSAAPNRSGDGAPAPADHRLGSRCYVFARGWRRRSLACSRRRCFRRSRRRLRRRRSSRRRSVAMRGLYNARL